MPRNTKSAREAQRTIRELVAVNEALLAKLEQEVGTTIELRAEVERLTEEVQVTEQEREQFRGWWHEERAKHKGLEEDRKRYEQERDQARDETQRVRWSLLGVEREREAARAHAEAMRERAFPSAPQFPWEEVRMSDQTGHFHYSVGNRR